MKIFNGYIFKSKDTIQSKPPEGYKQVVDIYVEPQTGVLVVVKKD